MTEIPAGDRRYRTRPLNELLFSFDGVISQNQFVLGIVILLFADVLASMVMMALLGVPISAYFEPRREVATAKMVAYVGLTFPYMAVGLKRLRARGIPPIAAYCVWLMGFLVAIEGYHQVIVRLKFMDFFGWLPTMLYVIGVGWLFVECAVLPERRTVDADGGQSMPLQEDQAAGE